MVNRLLISISLGIPLLTANCASAVSANGSGPAIPTASSPHDTSQRTGAATMRKLAEQFPGAVLLDETEFAQVVEGRGFRHRYVGSELIIERPSEFFVDGRYSTGHRAISGGSYSFKRGILLIDCSATFLGLNRERVFFRHQGKLFTTNADGTGKIVELIPAS